MRTLCLLLLPILLTAQIPASNGQAGNAGGGGGGAPSGSAGGALSGTYPNPGLSYMYLATKNGMACNDAGTGGGTDDTAAFNALLTAVNSAGGGTIYLDGICLIAGTVIFPNDGATIPNQNSIRITGGGASANGTWSTLPPSVSGLNLTANATVAKLDTRGAGRLEIDHIILKQTSTECTNGFIQTTNTTLHLHDMVIQGRPTGGCGTGIVLGGTTTSANGTSTAEFQGYGTVLETIFFDHINTGFKFRASANAITVQNNTFSVTCGGNPSVAIDLTATVNQMRGNVITGNLIELGSYINGYGIRCNSDCIGNYFAGNQTWDPHTSTIASYDFTGSSGNIVITSHDDAPPSGGWVQILGPGTANTIVASASVAGGSPDTIQAATRFGSQTLTSNGVASTPALNLSGTWLTGGSVTTNKPQLLVECNSGTTVTNNWNTAGAGIAANACSGFTGYLLQGQVNGVNKFSVDGGGAEVIIGSLSANSGNTILGNAGLYVSPSLSGYTLQKVSDGVAKLTNGHETVQTFFHAIASTIASGFGSSPAIAGNDTSGRVTVGTGGAALTGVINFGGSWTTAPSCHANNETTLMLVQATATTTTLTLTSASAWTAADKLTWNCLGY